MFESEFSHIEKIRHVLVAGGTHGNEYTGAFLARHWLSDDSSLKRDSFSTHVLFSNQEAFKICKRYVDRDLNRSFNPSETVSNNRALELSRARDIEQWLVSACGGGMPGAIFDLHSTTANMGKSLVLTNREPFNLLLLAYLRQRFTDVNAYLWEEPNSQPGFLNSLSSKGFAIEIGPVANGVLHAECVVNTAALVHACLDFIEEWNSGINSPLPSRVPLYCFNRHVDYPRGSDNLPSAMVHPELQNRDFQALHPGEPVFLGFDGSVTLWEGDTVWPVFINEAAYYEKGIAFTVTDKLDVEISGLKSKLS
jgi:aspartoacylase